MLDLLGCILIIGVIVFVSITLFDLVEEEEERRKVFESLEKMVEESNRKEKEDDYK